MTYQFDDEHRGTAGGMSGAVNTLFSGLAFEGIFHYLLNVKNLECNRGTKVATKS